MSKIFVRSPFNYDADIVSRETALLCEDDSLTKQSFAEECDINTIVRNFNLTGQLPENVSVPQYANVLDTVNDYQTALNMIMEADAAFMQMPANVRTRFHNNPAEFLDFFNDPANIEEGKKLGLVIDNTPVEPDNTPAANPAASNGGASNANS